jgi:hypothetical protein
MTSRDQVVSTAEGRIRFDPDGGSSSGCVSAAANAYAVDRNGLAVRAGVGCRKISLTLGYLAVSDRKVSSDRSGDSACHPWLAPGALIAVWRRWKTRACPSAHRRNLAGTIASCSDRCNNTLNPGEQSGTMAAGLPGASNFTIGVHQRREPWAAADLAAVEVPSLAGRLSGETGRPVRSGLAEERQAMGERNRQGTNDGGLHCWSCWSPWRSSLIVVSLTGLTFCHWAWEAQERRSARQGDLGCSEYVAASSRVRKWLGGRC